MVLRLRVSFMLTFTLHFVIFCFEFNENQRAFHDMTIKENPLFHANIHFLMVQKQKNNTTKNI